MIKCSSIPTIRSLASPAQCSRIIYSTRLAPLNTPRSLTAPKRQCRPFHTSPILPSDRSHYDALGVSPTASRADIKKRFYTLSKETHPDMNRDDPNANDRFVEVSEAYATLGNEEKRKKYDRDVLPRFTRTHTRSRSHNRSGTYAGSRPATGLSKRRGTFRGPPPSFYAHAHASPEEHARREQEAYSYSYGPGPFASAGSWDPTFNPQPIQRTQTAEDTRRNARRAAEIAAAHQYAAEEGAFWARFVVVSAVVAFGVGVGTVINRMSGSPRGGLLKADGTRRRELAAVR